MNGVFRLGEVRVDPDTLTLYTEDGARQVEARVMDVLLCLVREAPRTVSPEFMLDAVWSDVIVGDNSVHRAIATLRKSLGDNARAPTFIQTVPKRGYRLLAEVVEEAAPPEPPASAVAEPRGPAAPNALDFAPGDCLVACAHAELGLAQQLAAELSLAGVRAVAMPAEDIVVGDSVALTLASACVLVHTGDRPEIFDMLAPLLGAQHKRACVWCPKGGAVSISLTRFPVLEGPLSERAVRQQLTDFGRDARLHETKGARNRPSVVVLPFQSAGAEGEGLALGLLGELVTGLSRNRDYFVIATGTSLAYAERLPKLSQVSRELGVRYAVTGRVQQAGARLRITAELSDATMNHVVWADSWDRELRDVFDVQDEMAQAISAQIQPQLTRQEVHRAKARPVESLNAWERFQRVRRFSWKTDWLRETIDELTELVDAYPDFAEARALLAARLAYQVWFGDLSRFAEALRHAGEAERMAADNANVSVMAAIVFSHLGKADRALVAARRALSINPNLPDAWAYSGWCEGMAGGPAEGVRQLAQAYQLSPKDPMRYVWLLFESSCHTMLRDFPNALRSIDESIAVNRRWFLAFTFKAVAHAMLGEDAAALRAWNEAKELNPIVSIAAQKIWLGASTLSVEEQAEQIEVLERAGCE